MFILIDNKKAFGSSYSLNLNNNNSSSSSSSSGILSADSNQHSKHPPHNVKWHKVMEMCSKNTNCLQVTFFISFFFFVFVVWKERKRWAIPFANALLSVIIKKSRFSFFFCLLLCINTFHHNTNVHTHTHSGFYLENIYLFFSS